MKEQIDISITGTVSDGVDVSETEDGYPVGTFVIGVAQNYIVVKVTGPVAEMAQKWIRCGQRVTVHGRLHWSPGNSVPYAFAESLAFCDPAELGTMVGVI